MPDLRGLFLRGYGSQAHTQNNGSTVGVTSTLHESGSLGAIQGDATRRVIGEAHYLTGNYFGASGTFYLGGTRAIGQHFSDTWNWGGWSIIQDTTRVVPTAAENRPVNTAVRYLVRARP